MSRELKVTKWYQNQRKEETKMRTPESIQQPVPLLCRTEKKVW